jgi:low temperature requirement protein LtrA
MTQAPPAERAIEPAVRVSTLELFFDLVFVFTVTQLTAALADNLNAVGLLRVLLMLGVILWMYGGYAWLTNAVAPTNSFRRGLLFVGMAGFLGMALAIPRAFVETGAIFGLGYVVVNLVHSGLFLHSGGPGVLSAMRWLAPLNFLTSLLVLAGGLAPLHWRYALWTLAFAIQIVTPYLHPIGGFTISPAHFVERHGLVIIVALGESVVAIGVGAAGLPLNFSLLTVAVLGLFLAYMLWWTYFGGDDERAEHALASITDPARRARVALASYGYAHYPMLLGIVVLATGVKKAISHGTDHLTTGPALALGGGVALFLLGDVAFRRTLRIGRLGYRFAAGLAVLATVPLGLLSTSAQLGALLIVLIALSTVERLRGV